MFASSDTHYSIQFILPDHKFVPQKWEIELAGHNHGELANCGNMLELGAGHGQDCLSKLFE